jgi:diguanylate cyclase (GGDEF)-like protein/PAS domain S-box-containing protein
MAETSRESAAIRVLLLEDSPPDARRILDALSSSRSPHYEVEHVDRLQNAMQRVREERYDVALIDLCVLDSAGLGTFEHVREAAPHLPIVIQSGLDEDTLSVEAVRLGAQDYLSKENLDARLLNRALRHAVERNRAEKALRESEERYTLAFQGANDGLWDWNLAENRIHFSSRWKSMLGCDDEKIGASPDDWLDRVHPDDRDGLVAAVRAHLDGETPHLEHEYRIAHSDGSYLWVLCRGLAVRDQAGIPQRIAGSQTDVTRRKIVEERLLHDAFHDALTRLPNRALFVDRLGHALQRAKRIRRDAFAVLFLDLDRFKVVNDSLGHMLGDEMLVEVGRRLRRCLRPSDTVARLGGDEFAILLEDLEDQEDVLAAVDRIHSEVRRPVRLAGRDVFTSASIGIVHGIAEYDLPETLLRDADVAMYRAKHAGRSRHVIYDAGLHGAAVARLELETDLRHAFDRGEFILHYQPIIELSSGRTIQFEALLRWACPKRGLVSPVDIVPVLEETGMILPVGLWVIRESCRQLREWRNRRSFGDAEVSISVNLSSRQFADVGLVDTVASALRQFELPGSCLTLEITESILMDQPESAIHTLSRLRDLGVGVALDDFGTGYSSLSYLQRFPINRIKIDRSFVRGIDSSKGDLEIVRAMLGLGHSLGISVVAEGIETEEQLSHLRLMKCEFGQGFLFSRPLPTEHEAFAA